MGGRIMWDICCGLKGASAAMAQAGWKIYTLDLDAGFKPDACADVRSWNGWKDWPVPDLLWCSPPCTEFAREFMPWCRTGVAPDLSIVQACKRIIDQVKPRYWVIENVKGAVKWFEPILGRPAYVSNPYYLWGSFPDIGHIRLTSHKEHLSSSAEAERAKIPYKLSIGLMRAIEGQPGLFDLRAFTSGSFCS